MARHWHTRCSNLFMCQASRGHARTSERVPAARARRRVRRGVSALALIGSAASSAGAAPPYETLGDTPGGAGPPARARPTVPAAPITHDVLPAGAWELRVALGARLDSASDLELEGLFALNYAITDRLSWALPLPAFAYRWGEAGVAELIARGGLRGIGYSSIDGVIGTLDAGVAGRAWLTRGLSLLTYASSDWEFQTGPRQVGQPSRSDVLTVLGGVGFSWHVLDVLTLSPGAGWLGDVRVRDTALESDLDSEIAFGALQSVGYRPLPLVQVHLSPTFSLDAYAIWTVSMHDDPGRQFYLAGVSWILRSEPPCRIHRDR